MTVPTASQLLMLLIVSVRSPSSSRERSVLLQKQGPAMQGGVWVLGMIKGGAADRAGVRQGDELLRVNGQELSSLSPFKVAGLLQGTDSDNDSDSSVQLEVIAPPVLRTNIFTLPGAKQLHGVLLCQ